jgi:phosphoglycolate phosphatase
VSMLKRKRLVLFDLDGTLINSAPDIADAVDAALLQQNFPAVGERRVRRYIGSGVSSLIHKALTRSVEKKAPVKEHQAVYQFFLDYYHTNVFKKSEIYPHAEELLRHLKKIGWIVACVTNKPSVFTTRVLAKAQLAKYFDCVLSADSPSDQKPRPALLLQAMARYKIPANDTLMVGDSINDIEAAVRAGVKSIAVNFGYNGGRDLLKYGASSRINSLDQLQFIIDDITESYSIQEHFEATFGKRST